MHTIHRKGLTGVMMWDSKDTKMPGPGQPISTDGVALTVVSLLVTQNIAVWIAKDEPGQLVFVHLFVSYKLLLFWIRVKLVCQAGRELCNAKLSRLQHNSELTN